MSNVPINGGTRTQILGAIQLREKSAAPPVAVANSVILYAIDNGAGKTQLMALFPTGAAIEIAIEA